MRWPGSLRAGPPHRALGGHYGWNIEEMFSKFKEFLRRVGARAKEHLYEAIGEGLREVTPRDILGWFGHAGSCVMQA